MPDPADAPTYKWGILGPGGIAARFADDMRLTSGGEIAAVASRSLDRANAFADRFDVPARYESYEALAADPGIDVVYIATPHSRHAGDTVACLEAGKHVLCEKPFALNAGEARRMADAAGAHGRFLMEAMWSRFLPAYRTLVGELQRETIGEPLVVVADFGFRMPLIPDHRLFDRSLGGGALLDVGVYAVQLCHLVLGPPDATVAEAVIGPTGVDDQVSAILRYDAGQLGIAHASIRAATGCTARISGSDGWIALASPMHCTRELVVGTAGGEARIDACYDGGGMQFQIDEVHRCLREGRSQSPTMPLAASIAIMETLDAIRAEIGVTYPGE